MSEAFVSMEQSIGQFSFAIIFLSLCIILFAIVGQSLFSGVKRGPGNFFGKILQILLQICNDQTGITIDSNFDDAPHAILLLFKIATGERCSCSIVCCHVLLSHPCSWQLIQKDCSIQPPYCSQQGGENDDCGVAVAWMCVTLLFVEFLFVSDQHCSYFDAFFLMTRCVFLNLFTVCQISCCSLHVLVCR